MDIEALRASIDRIDREILALLARRAELSIRIARLKKEHNLPVRQPERESEILDTVTGYNTGPLTADQVRALFTQILRTSRELAEDA